METNDPSKESTKIIRGFMKLHPKFSEADLNKMTKSDILKEYFIAKSEVCSWELDNDVMLPDELYDTIFSVFHKFIKPRTAASPTPFVIARIDKDSKKQDDLPDLIEDSSDDLPDPIIAAWDEFIALARNAHTQDQLNEYAENLPALETHPLPNVNVQMGQESGWEATRNAVVL